MRRSSTQKNPYIVLGVEPTASIQEIRKAYLIRVRILHPDRIDPRTQPDEWKAANRMLAELNEAYNILRDPTRRSAYDNTTAPSASTERRTPPQPDPSEDEEWRRSTSQDGFRPNLKASIPIPIRSLPDSVKARLRQSAFKRGTDGFYLNLDQVLGHVILFMFLIILLPMFFAAAAAIPGPIEALVYLALAVPVGALAGYNNLELRRWLAHPTGAGIALTPLYFIRATTTAVTFYPLWTLTEYRPTRVYYNGIYSHTEVVLEFGAHTESFMLVLPYKVRRFTDTLNKLTVRLQSAFENEEIDYLARHDIFKDIDNDDFPPEDLSFEETRSRRTYRSAIALSCVIALFVMGFSKQSGITGSPSTEKPSPAQQVEEMQPPQSGLVRSYSYNDHIAPLSISASTDSHHFVKLLDSISGHTVVTIFVQRGSTTEVDVPLGRFYLRYASGTRWYGTDHLFGKETDYFAAHEPLEFSQDHDGVIGHEITLFRVRDGNLRTKAIRAAEF